MGTQLDATRFGRSATSGTKTVTQIDEGAPKEQVNNAIAVTVPDRMGLAPDVSAKRQVADGGNVPTVSPEILLAFQEISPESTVEEISSLIGMHQNIDVARAKQFANLYRPGKIRLNEIVEFSDAAGPFRKVNLTELRIMVALKNKDYATKRKTKTANPFEAAKFLLRDDIQNKSRSNIVSRFLEEIDPHIDNYIAALDREDVARARGYSIGSLQGPLMNVDPEDELQKLYRFTSDFYNGLLGGPVEIDDLFDVLNKRIVKKKSDDI